MFRYTFRLGWAVLTVAAGLSLAEPAPAQTVPHKEHCAGTLVDVVPGTLFFAGAGHATHFGHYTITGSNEFDALNHVFNGAFTSIAADDSTISGMYEGRYEFLPTGQIQFIVHVCYLVGTGRLEGVTGEADTVAILDGLAPGDAFVYDTEGYLTFP
jgi:hypothetical protein